MKLSNVWLGPFEAHISDAALAASKAQMPKLDSVDDHVGAKRAELRIRQIWAAAEERIGRRKVSALKRPA